MTALKQFWDYSLLEKITLLSLSILIILLPLESILSAFHMGFVSVQSFLIVWFITVLLCLIVRKWLWLLISIFSPWGTFVFCTWFLEPAIWYYGKEWFGLNHFMTRTPFVLLNFEPLEAS